MTCILSSQSSRRLEPVGPDLSGKSLLISTEDVDSSQSLFSLRTRESLMELTTNGTQQASNESDTDDDEYLAEVPPTVLTNSQRKRAQNAAFEEFVRERDEVRLQEKSLEVKDSAILPDGMCHGDPLGRGRIIDKVRDYQSELFARAKAGNIIAVLATGSGKTLIAALLLRDIVTKEMEDRASGKAPRTSFFLVSMTCASLVLGLTGSYFRRTVLHLPNNNTRCFVKTLLSFQLWSMAGY